MNQVLRRAAVSAASVVLLAAGAAVSSTPAHAAAYSAYKNTHSGTCLTAGKTGSVFVSRCNGSSYQQWAVGAGDSYGYYQVKNRATGKCLMTSYAHTVNSVWASDCRVTKAQLWRWGGPSGDFVNRDLVSFLRTSPRAGAVYSDKNDDSFAWSYYDWQLSYS